MHAMFGMPGTIELLIIGAICFLLVGVPIIVIVAALLISRSNSGRSIAPSPNQPDAAPHDEDASQE